MIEPSLTILARPGFTPGHRMFLERMELDWNPSEDSTDSERLIEFCGRVCYMSFDPNPRTRMSTQQYVRKLIKNGHESVLEHAQWTFLLDGVTRGFTHQLVRHRIGFSFSQLSQQYHDESRAEILTPTGLERSSELHKKWQDIEVLIHQFYSEAVGHADAGSAMSTREQMRHARTFARAILPNATRTIISVSANARSLRHFLKVRGGLDGDIEMRKVSALVFEMLLQDAPSVVHDFELIRLSDGSPKIIFSE